MALGAVHAPEAACDRSWRGHMPRNPVVPVGYEPFLAELTERIGTAQVHAAVNVNREWVSLYWQIGRGIPDKQQQHGWGASVVEQLSADLRRAFPEMKGFSTRNLRYMRAFAEALPDEPILQQPVAQLPWGHHVVLLNRLRTSEERLWYAERAAANG